MGNVHSGSYSVACSESAGAQLAPLRSVSRSQCAHGGFLCAFRVLCGYASSALHALLASMSDPSSAKKIAKHAKKSPEIRGLIFRVLNDALGISVAMAAITAFDVEYVTAVLARTPACLDALLRGLPDFWTRRNEGKDSWSAFDIVGHLIFADRTDWMPRLHRILNEGESVPFDPFDRLGQVRESQGKTLEQLLTEFAEVRDESLKELQALNLKPGDFERRGKHPTLGAVSAAQLLSTWAVHDLNHLHQLSRVMAHQYQDAVGPFKAYLGVLHCDAHGA